MKLTYQANNPREIEMTMTVTMTLGEWETIARVLDGSGAVSACEFRRKVQEVVRGAAADFGAAHT